MKAVRYSEFALAPKALVVYEPVNIRSSERDDYCRKYFGRLKLRGAERAHFKRKRREVFSAHRVILIHLLLQKLLIEKSLTR